MITFGIRHDATVRATDVVDRGFAGTTAVVTTPAGAMRLAVALPGRAQLMNVLAAVAVAHRIRRHGRGRLKRGSENARRSRGAAR